jgi:hypothetical protein
MEDLDNVIDRLSSIVKPVVDSIEKSTPICKDHYDQYMAAITKIGEQLGKDKNQSVYLGIGVAMQRAGANRQGVLSALRAMGIL